ncbi:MAG: hypothetical protein AAB447_00490 [Patescibacteria group bacterium]
MKKIILVITATFLLNFVWENAQAVLYQPHGDAWGTLVRCSTAAFGDVVLVGGIYFLLSIFLSSWRWFEVMNTKKWIALSVVSVAVAVGVEWWGLASLRWAYSDSMAIIPFVGVGVAPVAQLLLLNPLILFVSKKISL